MEGSSTGPANFGQLDPSVVNGSGPGPMMSVPAGGTSPGVGGGVGGGAAPGPAAVSLPGVQQQTPQQAVQQPVQQPVQPPPYNPMPPGVAELNNPAGAIAQLNLDELQAKYDRVRKLAVSSTTALIAIGVLAAMFLYLSIKGRVTVPTEVVV